MPFRASIVQIESLNNGRGQLGRQTCRELEQERAGEREQVQLWTLNIFREFLVNTF